MQRSQFTVYESFYKAIARMRKKADQADTFLAIARLALYGEEPDIDEMTEPVASALELILPVVRSGNNKALNRLQNETNENKSRTNENKPEQSEKQKEREKEREIEREIENDSSIKKDKKETKHRYGQYKNVLLSDDDMEKLKSEFPDWEQRIERLSEYIATRGDKYKNHLAVIRSWARKDTVTAVSTKPTAPTAEATSELRRLLESM